MGASESKGNTHEHLSEEQNVTPIQNRRVLKLQDPRSPSEDINRTPIVTDTTDFQDPRSPTAEICRTPVEETTDPRSPTEGIPRTPANPFIFPDPRSPSVEITRTPLIKSVEDEKVFQESEEQSGELRRRTVESSDVGSDSKESINNNKNNAEDNRLKDDQDLTEKSDVAKDVRDDGDTKAQPLTQINTPQYEVELAKMNLDETTSKESQK